MTTPDNTNETKITGLIKKLLTLAAEPSTPEEERYTAFAKASELMTRHGITEDQIRAARGEAGAAPEPIEEQRYIVTSTGGHGRARLFGVAAVAEALGCHCALFYGGPSDVCYMVMVGAASDIATARTLLPLVSGQAEYAAMPAARKYVAELRRDLAHMPPSQTKNYLQRERTRFYRSFLVAYGQAVAERIRARRGTIAQDAATAGTGADLVLADRETRAAANFQRRFPKLRPARRILYSTDGLNAGREAGQRADLGDSRLPGAGRRPELPGSH